MGKGTKKKTFLITITIMFLIYSIGSSVYLDQKSDECRIINQLADHTNETLYPLRQLYSHLEEPDWSSQQFRHKIYSYLELFYINANETYQVACKERDNIPDLVFNTIENLRFVACYMWDEYEAPFKRNVNKNTDENRQAVLTFTENIDEANFMAFGITHSRDFDSNIDSWYMLNKELNNYMEKHDLF